MSGYLFAVACAGLLCACYGAGRAALPPRWTAAVAAGALCVPAAQFAVRPASLAAVTGFMSAYLVFAALPLLAGRYVAVQRKAVEQERIRERLEIVREMHDSLGRRLSLAAVQVAALEVSSDLPAPQRAAIARLATAIRASATELHEIVAAPRGVRARDRGISEVGGLIREFRAAGAVVSERWCGTPRSLTPQAAETAYRVLEEGLTNAIRHAPGRPVNVTIVWEADMLLLTVVNPADRSRYAPGSGLTDLAGRLGQAGGSLGHEVAGGQFRLRAALPAARAAEIPKRPGVMTLGVAVGILLLVVLPAAVLLGVR